MSELIDATPSKNEIFGLGEPVFKLKDRDRDEVIAFIGINNQRIGVHFPRTIEPHQVVAVSEFLKRPNFIEIFQKCVSEIPRI
jgi:hypothetical protein